MSLIFATQLTAIATLALAALALATAILALLAWLKQSSEVRDQKAMLKLQAEEFKQLSAEREREALQRRRAQAAQVYMWASYDNGGPVCHVRNTSQQPIHKVELELLVADGSGPERIPGDPEMGRPLLPGERYHISYRRPPHRKPFELTATFRDNAGVWWRIKEDGQPEEISGPPPRHKREL